MNRPMLRNAVNRVLEPGGVRVVSSKWGPRGFAESFRRLQKQGVAPGCIVDVGASNGAWTRECMTVFPTSVYFLVDALEENRAELDAFHRTHSNVSYWVGALGRTAGRLPLHVHGDQSSFLSSEYDHTGSVREIAVIPLDELLRAEAVPSPNLIKADVQGYELEVLRGGSVALSTAEFVLLEVSYRQTYAGCPLAHEVIAAMAQLGFRIYDICTYSQRPRDLELFQSDILFAKNDSRVFLFEGYA
jgi:FkbM family methyltransferase